MSEEEGKPLSVYTAVVAMADQMAAIAWQKLGLQPDFMTGKIEPDLGQAKVAIDVVAHLAGVVDKELDDSDRREMHNLVSNLRLNYVDKAKEATS
jgi:hypothetical protein